MGSHADEESPPPRMRWVKRLVVAGFILFLAVLTAIFWPVAGSTMRVARKAKTEATLRGMATGTEAFYNEYFVYPTGDNATFVRVMSGKEPTQNRRGIVFVSFKVAELNAAGQILDAWRTPFEITYLDDGRPRFRSARPDDVFDTADDLVQTTTQP